LDFVLNNIKFCGKLFRLIIIRLFTKANKGRYMSLDFQLHIDGYWEWKWKYEVLHISMHHLSILCIFTFKPSCQIKIKLEIYYNMGGGVSYARLG
jgi:hypothetical protein